MTLTITPKFREVEVTPEETDQKNSGWHGPLILDEDTAEWIQEALNECDFDLIVGTRDHISEGFYCLMRLY